jgi:hypothetical protein
MQQVPKSDLFRYPKIKLYKDDVQNIIELFNSQYGSTLRIQINGYLIDNFDEISKIKENTTNKFKISSITEGVSLELTRKYAYLYLSNSNEINQLGLKSKIDDILNKRKRIFNFLDSIWFYALFSLVIGILIGIIWNTLLTIMLFTLELIYLVVFISPTSFISHSLIILDKNSQDLSFWRRNYEKIMIGIIIAVLSGIILFLFENLFLNRF